jgi:pimeloyl-ACP methyl ester carboxylesterase
MDTQWIESVDGVRLAVHSQGAGRPVVMLHGYMDSARGAWFGPGIAGALVAMGRRVIVPDLRGHGLSDAPTDPAAWPPDILAADLRAVVEALALTDYDVVGYSLGARTAGRGLVGGLAPRRAVAGGLGDRGIMDASQRTMTLEDAILNGAAARDPKYGRTMQRLIARAGLERGAMVGVLKAFQPTTEAELRGLRLPVRIVCGRDDLANGSPQRLAALIPGAELVLVPGGHNRANLTPEFTEAIMDVLGR